MIVLTIHTITLSLDDIYKVNGPNWKADEALLTIQNGGLAGRMLQPQQRQYIVGNKETKEASIESYFWYDIYVSLDAVKGQFVDLRIYYKPFAPFLWLGGVLMALGGMLALLDRKTLYWC